MVLSFEILDERYIAKARFLFEAKNFFYVSANELHVALPLLDVSRVFVRN